MIICPECGMYADEKNQSCPNCGYPFDGTEKKYEVQYCAECGEKLNDGEKECPSCGYSFENESLNTEEQKPTNDSENDKKEDTDEPVLEKTGKENFTSFIKNIDLKNHKTIGIVLGITVLIIIFIAIGYINSDFAKYKVAQKNYANKKYELAAEQFKKLDKYKDSKDLYNKSLHLDAVQKDKTAPTISFPSVKIEEGDVFDSATFVKNRVSVSDNVSKNLTCEMISSDVDVNVAGNYTITVKATDEAGNAQSADIAILVTKRYSLENLKKSVSSVYNNGQIPNLYDMNYDEDKKTLSVYTLSDGMAEATVYAKIDSSLKESWDDMAETLKKVSITMYTQLLADGYTEVDGVALIMLNDKNTDKVLLSFYNGVKVYDATD